MPTILRSKADMAKMDQIIADVKAALEDGTITEDMLNGYGVQAYPDAERKARHPRLRI